MKEMTKEQIQEIFNDEAFVKEVLQAEDIKAVQTMLADKGLELTEADIAELKDTLANRSEPSDELSDAELSEVAGGNAQTVKNFILGALAISPIVYAVTSHYDIRW